MNYSSHSQYSFGVQPSQFFWTRTCFFVPFSLVSIIVNINLHSHRNSLSEKFLNSFKQFSSMPVKPTKSAPSSASISSSSSSSERYAPASGLPASPSTQPPTVNSSSPPADANASSLIAPIAVVPARVLLGPSTNPFVTITREDNFGAVLNQLHAGLNDLVESEADLRAERRAHRCMSITRAPPSTDSLLIFPCLGKFADGEDGDTYNLQGLSMIVDVPDADNDFTRSNPNAWTLNDVIDLVGAYLVRVSDTESSVINNLSSFTISGTLIYHLDPPAQKPFSIWSCGHFPIGLKFKFTISGFVDDPADNIHTGFYLTPTPRLTSTLLDSGGTISLRTEPPPKIGKAIPTTILSKAAQLTVDGELIYMYDRTKFGEEKQDCLGFMRAFMCLPEKKIKLTGGVQDEHRLSEKTVASCMAMVDASVGKIPTFPYKVYIPRVAGLPIYSDTAKVLLFLKFKFSLHDLAALSTADLVPPNHVIDLSGTDRISLSAMCDGLTHMMVLFFHDGYTSIFDDTKTAVLAGNLTMIPDQVLHICLLFAWAHLCDTVTNSTANCGMEWKTNRNMIPDMFRAQLEADFALDRCLDIERNWISQNYESKYQLPAIKKRAATTNLNPNPAKATKLAIATSAVTEFCLIDLYFKYDYQTANAKRANRIPVPCAGKRCVPRHVDKGKLPPKSDVIAWLTSQATSDPKNKGHMTKFADYINAHF